MNTKEQVYDEQVAPLMAQIIGICEKAGIALLADFALGHEDDPDLRCTTLTKDEAGHNDPLHRQALHIVAPHLRPPLMLDITSSDGKTKAFISIVG